MGGPTWNFGGASLTLATALPTIDTFLIRPNAYPAKILEKGCPTCPHNRGCTVLKFVAGHGTAVQPGPINIVFGYKQTQRYSRTHQLGFIRAVSGSAQNAESHWSPVHITLIAEHFCFYTFYKCGLQHDLMSCSSRLMLQRP